MLQLFQLIPIITIICITFCEKKREIQSIALFFSYINLYHIQYILYNFQGNVNTFEFVFYGKLGQDGISLWQIFQISIQMPLIYQSTWNSIKGFNYKNYMIFQQIIVFWSYSVFLVMDILLFYISFEGVQIPMYLMIAIYGGRNRKIHAAHPHKIELPVAQEEEKEGYVFNLRDAVIQQAILNRPYKD